MNLSRSGYYKWLNNTEKKQYELDREYLCELIIEIHKKHPSWGYRKINAWIKNKTGWVVSDNLVHKCCKYLEIKSVVRTYEYIPPGEERVGYPNIISNNWKTNKPLEKVCSDMTCLKHRGITKDLTLYLDVFNNEIIGYGTSNKHGNMTTYYDGLYQYLSKIKEIDYQSILHSDQGNIYSSMAFTNAHKDYNIVQ